MESPDDFPLVSCIMPTYNRRDFVPLAIRYFLHQDYADKELIILDDGSDPVGDLIPGDKCIRYFRMGAKVRLGAKLNLACEYARGPVIAHWDDDDWYAPWRLRYQVRALIQEGRDLCGINRLSYYDLRTGRAYQYVYPADQRIWLSGSSLCYTKELWARNRFADIDVGMDGLFVWAVPPERIAVLRDSTFSVLTIHDHNASPKKTDGAWWHPFPAEEIQRLIGSDWELYRADDTEGIINQRHVHTSPAGSERSLAPPIRNIFACLVHENLECVVDLVRNLRYLDPSSLILLYNGGSDEKLLDHGFPFEAYGAVLHPSPRPMKWGRLHEFAVDCMRYALDNFPFDTLTIVDSDQLGVRSAYSHYLGEFLSTHSGVGMLSNSPGPLPATTTIAPAVQAFKEVDLWRPFLRRFPRGETKFLYWTFWPSTVFTVDAARDLTRLFASDDGLQDILCRSKIWATEEVILPTLVALLGYGITANPCSYDYVKYRTRYTLQQADLAFTRQDVFWIHPVPRGYDDALRKHFRRKFNHYEKTSAEGCTTTKSETGNYPELLLIMPILSTMKKVEGWLDEDEADLLIEASRRALTELPQPHAIVEVGSYCGRSTVVLGSVAKAICPEAKVYAIDPHDGRIGALDQGIRVVSPTLEKFKSNVERAGLEGIVVTLQKHPCEVLWDKPISLLLVDGLHDYVSVARDFFHFERWVAAGGYIAFHDYADYYPGVKAFVNEILDSGKYRKVHCARSMMVLLKLPVAETEEHKPSPA